MNEQELVYEFVQEITTGKRTAELQEFIDQLDKEIVTDAYNIAIDKITNQQALLSNYVAEKFVYYTDDGVEFREQVPDENEMRILGTQFHFLTKLLDIPNHNLFFIKVEGFSMIGAKIDDGDFAIAKRIGINEQVSDSSIVVVRVEKRYYVKRFRIIDNIFWLYPENPDYTPICLANEIDYEIIGVVLNIIKKVA